MIDKIIHLDKSYYMNTFGDRTPLMFEKGKGIELTDSNGDVYKDFFAGIAVNALGHSHPKLVLRLKDQIENLIHTSSVYYIKNQALLAEQLCKKTCFDKVFFANTGAEANEGAIKLARKYFYNKGEDKYEIITLSHHIAQHDGPHIGGTGTGVAGAEHTEDQAEGNTVEGSTDRVVVSQDEQTEHAHIHQENAVAQGTGNIIDLIPVQQQLPVILTCAHSQGEDHAQGKQHDAENIDDALGGHSHITGGTGQFDTHDLIEHTVEEEHAHTHRQSGRVQVKALVDIGRMGKACAHDDAYDDAHHNGQHKAQQIKADRLRMGVAQQQVGNDRCHTGGKEHSVYIGIELFLLDEVCHHNAQHGKPHIDHVDAPAAEAKGEQKCQGGYIIDLCLCHMEQAGHDQGNQAHVQEGTCKSTHGEEVGGDLAGLAQDLPEAGKHGAAVRHTECCCQEQNAHTSEQHLQEIAFGHTLDLFHMNPPQNAKNGQPSFTKLNCPDGRHSILTLHRSALRYPSVM